MEQNLKEEKLDDKKLKKKQKVKVKADEVKEGAQENEEEKTLSQPLFVHGKYDNPWPEWSLTPFMKLSKWIITRKVPPLPSIDELDKELPVVEPNWEAIEHPGTILDNLFIGKDLKSIKKDENNDDSNNENKEKEKDNEEENEEKIYEPNPLWQPHDYIQITWIGHSAFLVQMEGFNILTDPVFCERASPLGSIGIGPKRFRPTPFTLDRLPPIDFVLISHNHYDHLDAHVVQTLGNNTKWFIPQGLGYWFRKCGVDNFEELNWWEETIFINNNKENNNEDNDNFNTRKVKIACVPAQHWSFRNGMDKCKSLWSSWVVIGENNENKGKRLFFSGDTGYNNRCFKEVGEMYGPFDLGLIPIGAYCPRDCLRAQHVDPAEAVQMHIDIQSRTSIGMHWGTFILTDEHVLEPPIKLREALEESDLDSSEFFVISHGETKLIY